MDGRPTVLVIDDEAPNLSLMRALLQGQGYDVLVAESGREGFAAAVESTPDIVLLDVFMPGEDGTSVCRRLRADERTSRTPVIAVTGRGDREVKLSILEAGANDFLEKPVEPVELLLRLRNMLDLGRVDELRRSRERLARTLELNQSLIDSFPFAAVMVDRQSRHVLLANRIARQLGSREGAPCGAGFGRTAGGQVLNAPCADCRADEAFSSGGAVARTDVFDGRTWWDLHWVPVDERRYLHYIVDVGTRHRAEEERARLSEQLERGRQLSLVGRLAAGVAHEVRTPLHAILSLSDALEAQLGTHGDHGEFLGHMRNQVQRLAAFMDELLDLGRPVDHDAFRSEPLARICSEALEIWREGSRCKGVAVAVGESRGASALVACDARRLHQALFNLIENAAQHSAGQPVVVEMPPPVEGRACIRVVDSGPGLPAGCEESVFEPFFTTRRGGTGLGLNIVRHIVEEHGGSVALRRNDPPPGCTAEVRLPIAEGSPP